MPKARLGGPYTTPEYLLVHDPDLLGGRVPDPELKVNNRGHDNRSHGQFNIALVRHAGYRDSERAALTASRALPQSPPGVRSRP